VYLSSIAVTNHFIESHQQKESDGLPSMDLYFSPYDITKRRGEEMVLAANSESLRTCALRPGGILLSPHDFTFRNALQNIGGMNFLAKPSGMKQIDFIDGRDVVRAMLLASQALEAKPEGVAGEAFFCTKGEAADPGELAVMCKAHLGWPLLPVPEMLTRTVAFGVQLKYIARKALGLHVTGVPPHKFMQMAFMEQTFDNSKIRERLGFQPKVPVADAVARICTIYKQEAGALAMKNDTGAKFVLLRRILVVLLAYVSAAGFWNAARLGARRRRR
jgi:nucleoside-diphosphate-sugar epimerase